ncbi:MAG: hypothetical protein RML34_07460 [Leptospiraceae bacterium]|nr:hypothetical protein [Leptospiraceae bacterium]
MTDFGRINKTLGPTEEPLETGFSEVPFNYTHNAKLIVVLADSELLITTKSKNGAHTPTSKGALQKKATLLGLAGFVHSRQPPQISLLKLVCYIEDEQNRYLPIAADGSDGTLFFCKFATAVHYQKQNSRAFAAFKVFCQNRVELPTQCLPFLRIARKI